MRNFIYIPFVLSLACQSGGKVTYSEPSFEAETVVDNDGDGFLAEEDCDDTNAAIHPEAIEVCDFIDNDCDEKVDREDDVALTDEDPICYLDDDGDGYGDIEDSGLHTCSCEEGETNILGDCNDKDREIHPNADFFGYPTPDGHFDYNCDGIEEHHYIDQGVCEINTAGKGCTFSEGWVNGTPACGGISGIMIDCTYNDSKGTRPATGTGGTGSTGGTSSSTPVCEPEVIKEQAQCR